MTGGHRRNMSNDSSSQEKDDQWKLDRLGRYDHLDRWTHDKYLWPMTGGHRRNMTNAGGQRRNMTNASWTQEKSNNDRWTQEKCDQWQVDTGEIWPMTDEHRKIMTNDRWSQEKDAQWQVDIWEIWPMTGGHMINVFDLWQVDTGEIWPVTGDHERNNVLFSFLLVGYKSDHTPK